MKVALAILGSLVLGILLTWACLYVPSHFEWKSHFFAYQSQNPTDQCFNLEHCANAPWWLYALVTGVVLGPTAAITALNAYALLRDWPLRKWSFRLALLVLGIVAVYGLMGSIK